MLVAEDVLLLLIDPAKGSLSTSYPEVVLGGALLSELALVGAVAPETVRRFRSRRVHAVAGAVVADPLLEACLGIVAQRPRCSRDLVARLGRHRLEAVSARLEADGAVVPREVRVLGLFRRCRWSVTDTDRRERLLRSLNEATTSAREPDDRTRALLALLVAAGVDRLIASPGLGRRDVRRRARELARRDWAAAAVREAIRATETSAIGAGTAVAGT